MRQKRKLLASSYQWFAAFFLLIACSFSLQAQDLIEQYEQRQLKVKQVEADIEAFIDQNISQPIPQELIVEFDANMAKEAEEHGIVLSSGDRQQAIQQLKRNYWRVAYFDQNPSAKAPYQSLVVSSCTNGDFEMGSFASYGGESAIGSGPGYQLGDCDIETADPTYQSNPIIFTPDDPNTAIANNFAIMTVGPDPNVTTATLQRVWNGNNSARINNDLPSWPNYGANKLTKRVVLDQVDEEIFFNYALVLEDPGSSHNNEKPTFVARVLDVNGNECDRICHAAYSTDPFLLDAVTGGSVRYKPWACEGLSACGAIGDTVTLEFIQTDCGQGGHWGYAYIDDICDTCSGIPDSCNYLGDINLLPTDTCVGDTMQVCGTYALATQNCSTSVATEIRLYIRQGGAIVAGPFIITSPTGGNFCFTVDPSMLPPGTMIGDAFDFYVEIDFSINGGIHTENDYNTNPGLDNDYVLGAECCPEFFLLTCCDLTDNTSTSTGTLAERATTYIDPKVQSSLDAYKNAVFAAYPAMDTTSDPCCDFCEYPNVAFPVFIYDENGMLIDNSVYTITWSNDPMNNTAIGYVLPEEMVIVTVFGPDSCVWVDTFFVDCCDEPGLPGICCDTIDFTVDLDSVCNFNPCDFPNTQFPIVVTRNGVVIGIPAYSFQWSNGGTGSATSASQSQLPITVTVTDNSTGCETVGVFDIDCDPDPCVIQPPTGLNCTVTHGGQLLSWSPVANAVSYEITFYYNDPDCCPKGGPGSITIPIPVNGTSYFVSNLNCFSWRVRAICEDGTVSDWSVKSCSCTSGGCEIIAPVNLRCSFTRSGQLLTWDPVFNAVSYEIEFYYNDPECCRGGFGSITIPIPVNGTSYLEPNLSLCFSWRVRAVCADGTRSPWSVKSCSCSLIFEDDGDDPKFRIRGSIDETSAITVNAMPNPAKDMVNIIVNDPNQTFEDRNAMLVIYDLSNKEVHRSSITFDQTKQVDLSGFEAGIYIYRVIHAEQIIATEKLLVE